MTSMGHRAWLMGGICLGVMSVYSWEPLVLLQIVDLNHVNDTRIY